MRLLITILNIKNMKILSNFLIVFLAVSLFVSCKNAPEGEAAKTGEASEEPGKPSANAQTFEVTDGKVFWAATKVGGAHNGSFTVSRGKIAVENGAVTGGVFMIDINSMTEVTMSGEMNTKFLTHMKSDDFFDAANHPQGQFTIVSIEPLTGNAEANSSVKGNLELNGITKSVTFPANILVLEDKVSVVSPKFTINRTEWDMKYNAAIIGTAADKIIHDDVALNVQLEAAAR